MQYESEESLGDFLSHEVNYPRTKTPNRGIRTGQFELQKIHPITRNGPRTFTSISPMQRHAQRDSVIIEQTKKPVIMKLDSQMCRSR